MPNAHAQFTHVAFSFTAFRALADQLNPCESIWCLTTAARNFYQPVLAKIYSHHGGVAFFSRCNYSAEHVYTSTVSEFWDTHIISGNRMKHQSLLSAQQKVHVHQGN